jgi:hypothetical protein
MEFKNRFDKIIYNLEHYINPSEDDIDYIIEYYPDRMKEVLLKFSKSIKSLMVLNEFLIKEMD